MPSHGDLYQCLLDVLAGNCFPLFGYFLAFVTEGN